MIARVLTAAAILTAGTWALWPLRAPSVSDPVPGAAASSSARPATTRDHAPTAVPDASVAPAGLDLAVFRTPLWVSPPPPPPPPPAPPPPPPLKLQLVAIVGGPSVFKAMIYDPDRDQMLTVSAGDALGSGRVVERVDKSSVSIRDAVPGGIPSGTPSPGLVRTLSLDSSSTAPLQGGAR